MKNKIYTTFLEYLGITFGCALMSLGLVFFLEPNTIAPGGVTGLAIVIQKVAGIPIDVSNLVINVPLFIAGIFILGGSFGAKTIYATLSLSAFIRIFTIFGSGYVPTNDLLLSSIFGGVAVGVGIGMVFRSGGTTGGTDLAGAILNKYLPNISIPKLMAMLDFLVVVAAGIVVRNIDTALYSIISLYILTQMADFIVDGLNYSKAFYIISDRYDEISGKIISDLDRGVTILEGRGYYTGADKNVILCIVDRAQVANLKKLVYEIDERAFMMVHTVHEVLGEGFKEVKK